MKKLVFAVALAAFVSVLAAGGADAQVSNFGLGVIVGEPTGVDAKWFLDDTNAIEGALAWSLSNDNNFHIQVDYLYHQYEWIKAKKGRVPVFFGLGGRIEFRQNRDDLIGLRIPVGIAYEFADAPFDLFGEIVPLLDLFPDTDFSLEGAIGARFWF